MLESKNVLVVSTVIVPIVPSVICAHESLRPRYLDKISEHIVKQYTAKRLEAFPPPTTSRFPGVLSFCGFDGVVEQMTELTDRYRHFVNFVGESYGIVSSLRWCFVAENLSI